MEQNNLPASNTVTEQSNDAQLSSIATEVSVLSYNILADGYTYRHFFPNVKNKHLNFSYRSSRIIGQIEDLSSDIICLQEVDHLDGFYQEKIANLGYSMIYGKKTSGRCDGCLVGFKEEKFQLLDKKVLKFDKNHKYSNDRVFKKGAVAVFAKLKMRENPKTIINVVCTHLPWDPRVEHVRHFQISLIYKMLWEFKAQEERIVMCGDFNSLVKSNVVQLILNKEEPDSSLNQHSCNIKLMRSTYKDMKDLLPLFEWKSAYSTYADSKDKEEGKFHPKYTQWTEDMRECIDYIFYTPNGLKVKKLLRLPTEKEIGTSSLPNKEYPSDHLPLQATFEIN